MRNKKTIQPTMDKYLDIFVKSVISASGIMFLGGVCFMIKILTTYNDTLTSIEKRITNIESTQSISDQRTNTLYNYFIVDKNGK